MVEDSSQIVWIILNAVKNLNIGKYKIAEFLKGSRSKKIDYIKNEQGYGGLLWYDIPTIMGFIEQIDNIGLISRKATDTDDFFQVLELTEAGKKVLNEKISIELQLIKKEKTLTVGETEKATYNLFKQGKTIEEIAKERNLAISTIYYHMHCLVANNYISSREFISEDKISKILEAKRKLPSATKLKEIKEILPEDIKYEEIRCVLVELGKDNNNQEHELKPEFIERINRAEKGKFIKKRISYKSSNTF